MRYTEEVLSEEEGSEVGSVVDRVVMEVPIHRKKMARKGDEVDLASLMKLMKWT